VRDGTDAVREPGTDWRRTIRRRTIVLTGIMVCWVAAVEARLVYLQIVVHAHLVARAERQQLRTIAAPAKRGDILDRRGRVLATSVDADSVYAVPSEIRDGAGVVEKLCGALRDCTARDRQTLLDRLQRQREFEYVRRQASPEQARRVADLNLDGIGFLKESRRYYPKTDLAAHVLGYVGIDNKGLGGLESAYDAHIRGKDGAVLVHTDGRRRAFSRVERPPTAGVSIELTIDEYLQHIAERELQAGLAETRAAGGSAIIMDPRTGEILALANAPTFNPNAYGKSSPDARRNRAVQDLYEPGSTFKIVTAAAAIEENVVGLDTPIDVTGGQIRIGARIVRDDHPYGVLSFADVIVKSSNVGAIKVGFRLGAPRLGEYVRRFGFGRPISPDFPGENRGIVSDPAGWSDGSLASVSFGHEIGVTPLQMVAAVSSIANGGDLIEPRVVGAVYRGSRRFAVAPKALGRTVTRETAAALTEVLEGVVERGTARNAQIPGFTIAGKTGTARKIVNGRYSRSDYNASFVGFLPSRGAVAAIVVVVDSPRTSIYGGAVAVPIFRRIAEATLRYLGVPPTINPAPPVLIARGEAPMLTPAAATEAAWPVVSVVSEGPAGSVPDVRGMTGRDAVRRLALLGLTARITGDGVVVSQDPEPGAALEDGGVCVLTLDRAQVPAASRGTRP
jgi:cell division protein FtsI/penicillin-binding protein 2